MNVPFAISTGDADMWGPMSATDSHARSMSSKTDGPNLTREDLDGRDRAREDLSGLDHSREDLDERDLSREDLNG